MKKRTRWLMAIVTGCSLLIAGWRHEQQESARIVDFNYERDSKDMLAMFDEGWFWLIPGDRKSYSPELMMKYRAPHQNPLYAGRLNVKVLRDKKKLIGFVAWYFDTPDVAFLNFVYVDPAYRGKRYAQHMIQYALDAMKRSKARRVTLMTRLCNDRARAVYKRMGFIETKQEGPYVWYSYYLS